MPQPNQEYTARRFQGFDTENPAIAGPRYDPGYDCEPPQFVRTELLYRARKRTACISFLKWAGTFALCAVILAGVIGNYTSKPHSAPTAALAAPATAGPLPQSVSVPEQDDDSLHDCPSRNLSSTAPRGELVRLPVRRATLVRLPH